MQKLLKAAVVVISSVLSATAYATTAVAELPEHWVGLLPERDKLKFITVNLEKGAAATSAKGPRDNQRQQRAAMSMERGRGANHGQALALQFGEGESVSGQVIIDVATLDATMPLTNPQVYPLQGEYFAALNLLKFQFHPPRQQVVTLFAALNKDNTQMYVFYGGPAGNTTAPFILTSGYTLPAMLQGIAEPREVIEEARLKELKRKEKEQKVQQKMDALRLEAQQARAAGDAERVNQIRQKMNDLFSQSAQNNAAKMHPAEESRVRQQQLQQKKRQRINAQMSALNTEIIELQTKIAEARRDGNHEIANSLTQQLQELRIQQQDVASGRHAVLREKSGKGCMPVLQAWLSEMTTQSNSSGRALQPVQLLNLFRPSVFNRHFDKALFELDDELREGYKYELARVCSRDAGLKIRQGDLNVIASGFGDDRGVFDYTSAGIGGMALDGVDEWQRRTVNNLAVKGDEEALSEFAVQSHYILNAVWPAEQTEGKATITNTIEKAKTKDIFAEVDARVALAKNGNLKALLNAAEPRTLANWFSTDLRTQDKVRQYVAQQIPDLLSGYFTSHSVPASADFSSPEEALMASKAWYEENKELFIAFNTQPAIKQMLEKLYLQRDASYNALLQSFQSDITAADSATDLEKIGKELYIKPDKHHSKVWQQITEAKKRRQEALDQVAYIARVGKGPLNAEDDGAVYINALYRGDFKIIEEEDKKFATSMVKMSEPLLNSGVFELMSLFAGDQSNANAMKQAMRERIQSISMTSAMTGLFIVAYEHLAAKCLGPNPVDFERTVVWEEVSQNILGEEFYRNTFSKTYYYTIAQRHADLFAQLGQGTSAGSLEAMGSIYGAFGLISQDIQQSIFTLSGNLRGVTNVMQRYECDSEEMQTLEKSLLDITRSRL